jgi:hypothetical protein
MRYLALAVLALGAAQFGSAAPAAARDYPYCLQSRGLGYPGDCSYTSYRQCMASASGRNAGCAVNPRVAFENDRRMRRNR